MITLKKTSNQKQQTSACFDETVCPSCFRKLIFQEGVALCPYCGYDSFTAVKKKVVEVFS